MEGHTLQFNFGDFGSTNVTLFHPPINTTIKPIHLLFVPPFGTNSLTKYKERLDKEALSAQGWLYALTFPVEGSTGGSKAELNLIRGSLLFLRSGSEQFRIITCNLETLLFVCRDKRWRNGQDQAVVLNH